MTGDETLGVRVLRGTPSDVELAALVAVVGEAYAVEASAALAADETTATPWRRTQRALRAPLRRDVAWGRFIG